MKKSNSKFILVSIMFFMLILLTSTENSGKTDNNTHIDKLIHEEIEKRRWHRNRLNIDIQLPKKRDLKRIDKNGWNTIDSQKEHLIFKKEN